MLGGMKGQVNETMELLVSQARMGTGASRACPERCRRVQAEQSLASPSNLSIGRM